MDEDYGTDLADIDADLRWCAEHNICPECGGRIRPEGTCYCDEEN